MLTLDNGTPATLRVSDRPPFLTSVDGLYLGASYPVEIVVDGDAMYMRPSNKANVFYLTSGAHPDNLSVTLLTPSLMWGEEASIDELNLDVTLPDDIRGYIVENPAKTDHQLVYSPTACDKGYKTCGVCPEDASPSDGACKAEYAGVSFGVRSDDSILCYKMTTDETRATVAASALDLVSAGMESDDIVRERLFYVERTPTVGERFPIYIRVNGKRKYLSGGDGTHYRLTDSPRSNGAALTPTRSADWREMVLTSKDFDNFVDSAVGDVALWRGIHAQGETAIRSAPEPARVYAAPRTFVPETTPTPIWKRWWFWVLVAIALILLVFFLKKILG